MDINRIGNRIAPAFKSNKSIKKSRELAGKPKQQYTDASIKKGKKHNGKLLHIDQFV